MPEIFRKMKSVTEAEVDVLGHMNNAIIVQWMQEIAEAHSTQLGWSTQRYLQMGQAWVAQSHSIRYLRPAFLGDQIQIRTWIEDVRAASSLRKYEFHREDKKELISRAETRWAFVQLNPISPAKIPEELHETLSKSNSLSEVRAG